jgi:hypothetical protein
LIHNNCNGIRDLVMPQMAHLVDALRSLERQQGLEAAYGPPRGLS